MKTLALLALLAGSALGDELRLKDGRTVPWKTLSDEGDEYLVDGKARVKKADVDRFVIGKAVPLTGASFTLDVKKVTNVDLLSKAEVGGKDTVGVWKWDQRVLLGATTGALQSRIPFDVTALPEEYDLLLQVAGGDTMGVARELAVGLVVPGGRQVAFHFDAFDRGASCLSLVDGANGESVPGQVFSDRKPRTVRFMVRREALVVQVDGKDFWTWKADWSKVSLAQAVVVRPKDKLFVVAVTGSWRILSAGLLFVK